VNIANALRVSVTEGIMIQAPRFSRAARGERRAAYRVAEHRLLDERGTFLGKIDAGIEPPVFGPLEPTVYLHRDRSPAGEGAAPGEARAAPLDTSAPREEDSKR
jgi:hypothetical protein